ncbi:MAG: M81 family metallopeptidase [Planctomycetes bacterium]|nr:M81 family metallopeptidase [Planctomycetota bacterium]
MSGRRKRVLLAGLFHETHTFLDENTPLQAFAVRRGDELLAARGDGSPLDGAISVADECGWELVPVIDLRATPSGTVEDAVLQEFWSAFRDAFERERPRSLDGIFLVLHGAMASVSVRDVEGELIGRIRRLPGGGDVPICGVLDLHGNISQATIEKTDGVIAYRRNPHTDSRSVAVDAARLLDRILSTGRRPRCVWAQPPVMWPPTGTGTDDDPMRTLEAMAREIEAADGDVAAVNVLAGFSFADTRATGVSFSAVTFGDAERVRSELLRLCEWTVANRETGNRVDPPLADVLPEIKRRAGRGEGPILIVEPSDNVGGGAPGDGTSVLRALVREGIGNSAVVINDAAAVAVLRTRRPGDRVTLSIGDRGSRLAEGPLELDVELVSVSDGRFDLEDRHSHLASMSGVHIEMGDCAVVRWVSSDGHSAVSILLTSRKTPPFDLGQLRSQGLVPESLSVIGVKAAVAHRRAYERIAAASFTVSTPGPCTSDLARFPWQHVRRPVYPLDEIASG